MPPVFKRWMEVQWPMDRQMIIDHLELAERHIARGTDRVEHQRQLIEELTRDGQDTTQATAILTKFEEVLAMQIADRDRLLKELDEST